MHEHAVHLMWRCVWLGIVVWEGGGGGLRGEVGGTRVRR